MMVSPAEETNREPTLADVIKRLDEMSDKADRYNEKFEFYQQGTRWVVQLAFTLIASATITVILSAVLK